MSVYDFCLTVEGHHSSGGCFLAFHFKDPVVMFDQSMWDFFCGQSSSKTGFSPRCWFLHHLSTNVSYSLHSSVTIAVLILTIDSVIK